ncbi:50S ribosomal protein L24 [Candidatus Woesebacteria bacterium]|nr:50S ribosomal protein L24 [Candidatus Woesebacteria bacterium]
MLKFKVGDKVKILAGKDKGREGNIETILVKKDLAVVPGVNVYKRHAKGTPGGQKAGIYELSRALPLGKIGLICPKCKKVTRVGFKAVGDEKRRVCAKCGREIDTKQKVKK